MSQTSHCALIRRGRFHWGAIFACLAIFSWTAPASSQVILPTDFSIQTYASGMYRPVDLEWAANGVLFVATKKGIVWVVKDGIRLSTPFMDIQDEVNGTTDRGMLGFTTHPDFPNTPWVYAIHTYDPPEAEQNSGEDGPDGKGQRVSRLVRYTADAGNNYETVVPDSAFILLGENSTWANIGNPSAEQTDLDADWACGNDGSYIEDCIPADGISHTVGTLKFGPDGMLYVSIGDAASYSTVDRRALRSIRLDSLAGKILRIDPATGEGLDTNPYWDGDEDSNRSKVWNLGLRNPYRFNFDPNTDKLWISDVGWGDWEELNLSTPGADFGWPCYEGDNNGKLQQPGYAALAECSNYYQTENSVPAVYSFEHVDVYGGAMVVGDVYTGIEWPADYQDALFFTDYATQDLFYAQFVGDSVNVVQFGAGHLAVDMVFGPDGHLYTVDVVEGTVSRIVYQGAPNGEVLSTFNSDFSPVTPPPGWVYKWNATSALENSSGHQPLLWDGSSLFDSDGLTGLPDNTSMANGFIAAGSMHPGRGVADGETDNRHAIAEYSVTQDGYYSIYGATATHTGCISSDGVQITVLVNNTVFESRLLEPNDTANFDEEIGYLVAGSTVAVAVGPNGTEICDTTDINWSLVYRAGTPPVGNPPTVTITSPNPDIEWIINDSVNFAGTATDPEDGNLTGTNLFWDITVFHNEHQHPDLVNATGSSGSFVFPDHDDNSYIEICLVATDSDGRIGKACVDARPDEVIYTFNSAPSGFNLTYNGKSLPTPFSVPVPIGGVRQISAPMWQGTHLFNGWSIGGPATQQVLVSNTDLSIDANYQNLGGVPQTFETSTLTRSNDAEESLADGIVTTGSSDLEMTLDGDEQLVGLRFTDIPIDAGAMITSAWVQFTADETDSLTTNLLIEGEAGSSAFDFGQNDSISGRTRTAANVAWNVPAWTAIADSGLAQRTPDLSVVITEIITAPDWLAGNSLALIVSGSGKRVAEAVDGPAGSAMSPKLHIEYVYPAINQKPTLTITAPADGSTVNTASLVNFTATATDAEDGDVAADIAWISSLDGALGTGGSVSTTLTIGTHTISASVTDSGGASDASDISVDVIQAPIFSGEISIDIVPGDATNFVTVETRSSIPVAVLTTSVAAGDAMDFDSQQVDGASVQFGPLGASPLDPVGSSIDVDSDGDLDKTFMFDNFDTGIICDDTTAELNATTFDGATLHGIDFVSTEVCPACHP